jgi:hypothetical protein
MDSNTYIQAKNSYYDMDFCPGYWEWLEQQFHAGNIFSIDNVYIELVDSNDSLSDWAKDHQDHFSQVDDNETQATFAEIANHVMTLDKKAEVEKAHFLSKADPWIIAKANTTGATIVTHEVRVPAESKKVKIPNIAETFGVACINTYELLRTLEAKFVSAS